MPSLKLWSHLCFISWIGYCGYQHGWRIGAAIAFAYVYGCIYVAHKASSDEEKRKTKCKQCKRAFHGPVVAKCQFHECPHDLSELRKKLDGAIRDLAYVRTGIKPPPAVPPTAANLRALRPKRRLRGLSPALPIEPAHASSNTDKKARPRGYRLHFRA